MKSKTWGMILAVVMALCLGLGIWPLLGKNNMAEVWSEGNLIQSVSLAEDQSLTVETERGVNVITVRNGKIAVTQADCPDGYCMKRGFCNGGMPIVCLPNRLVIRFSEKNDLDGISG